MQPVQPCGSYHAVCNDKELLRLANGRSALKVYYVDIIGRPDPARTVWAECGHSRDEFRADLVRADGVAGVGFITAFPHITKLFRFGPERETILNVRAWSTPDMKPLDLSRDERYVEFACLAEAIIAAHEYVFWAEADTVDEYLARWSDFADGPILRADKLLHYWNG